MKHQLFFNYGRFKLRTCRSFKRHEFQVIKGIKDKIKKIRFILVEFHNDEIYISYNPKELHNYLQTNNFKLINSFKFPFTTWEDRLYMNLKK